MVQKIESVDAESDGWALVFLWRLKPELAIPAQVESDRLRSLSPVSRDIQGPIDCHAITVVIAASGDVERQSR